MSDLMAHPWRSEDIPARALLALRLSIELVFDVSQISRAGGDLLDPLILTGMLEANQAALRHDPGLAQAYGDARTALPDALRRPVSISALANSLHLPFETVRRRVRALTEAGLCLRVADGIYVPEAVVTSARYRAVQAARVARLSLFERDLEQAGLLAAVAGKARPLDDVVRAADRALAAYMLRICDRLILLVPGAVPGFVLLGLAVLNAEGVSRTVITGLDDIAADARPCTASALARRLGMPAETVRRQLVALGERGFARRGPDGWMASAPAAAAERLNRLVADHDADLRRLLIRLRQAQHGNAVPGEAPFDREG